MPTPSISRAPTRAVSGRRTPAIGSLWWLAGCLLAAAGALLLVAALSSAATAATAPRTDRPGIGVPARPASAAPPVLEPTPIPAVPTPSPVPPGNPTPPPAAPAPQSPPETGGGLGGLIAEAIRAFLLLLVANAASVLLGLFVRVHLVTPDVTVLDRVVAMNETSMAAVNVAFVLLILVGGILAMSHETLQSQYPLREIAVRLVAGYLLANVSMPVCSWAIRLANGLTAALLQGITTAGIARTLQNFVSTVLSNSGLVVALLVLVFLVGIVMVYVTFWLRLILLILLVGFAPLALVCHALPGTQPVAMWWWKGLAACLGTQVAQGAVLAAAIPMLVARDDDVLSFASSPLMAIIAGLVLVWLLWKIPFWALAAIRGHAPRAPRLLRYLVVNQAMQSLSGAVRRTWRSWRGATDPTRAAAGLVGRVATAGRGKVAAGAAARRGKREVGAFGAVLSRRGRHAGSERRVGLGAGEHSFGQVLFPARPGSRQGGLRRRLAGVMRAVGPRAGLRRGAGLALGLGAGAATGGGSLAATGGLAGMLGFGGKLAGKTGVARSLGVGARLARTRSARHANPAGIAALPRSKRRVMTAAPRQRRHARLTPVRSVPISAPRPARSGVGPPWRAAFERAPIPVMSEIDQSLDTVEAVLRNAHDRAAHQRRAKPSGEPSTGHERPVSAASPAPIDPPAAPPAVQEPRPTDTQTAMKRLSEMRLREQEPWDRWREEVAPKSSKIPYDDSGYVATVVSPAVDHPPEEPEQAPEARFEGDPWETYPLLHRPEGWEDDSNPDPPPRWYRDAFPYDEDTPCDISDPEWMVDQYRARERSYDRWWHHTWGRR